MDANQAKSLLQTGQKALYRDGEKLMYTDGNIFIDVRGAARMFQSRNWSASDIEGHRFYEASQESGIDVDEIQNTLNSSEIFIYTPNPKGKDRR